VNAALAAAAATLIGIPFRLHGRDPATGLDCIGVVAEALRRIGAVPLVPQGYRMRAQNLPELLPFIRANGFCEVSADEQGDTVLAMVNPVQPHMVVCAERGFIHAHAGIGRVTFMPGALPWPVANAWRVPDPLAAPLPSTGI
jgi:hypothetical protein